MDAWGEYAWTDDPRLDAFCVSVIVGASEAVVVEAFAVDVASRRVIPFAEQWDLAIDSGFGNDVVQIDRVGGAVVCLEANGWAGVDAARAAALSAAGVYASLYRSVNADMQFVAARRGQVVRTFDPLLYEAVGSLAEESDLPFGDAGHCEAAAFALLERLTGVRLTSAWLLEDAHPAYRRDPFSDG